MKPYYQDEHATIYHGDCRELLPAVRGGAVVTDPPYGLSFRGMKWDSEIPDWLPLARACAPIVVFTTAPTTQWDYPRPDWVACWSSPGSTSRAASGGFNHWTPILIYGKVKFAVDHLRLPRISNITRDAGEHPSPKPLNLMQWIIAEIAADNIIDPFAGSGSTLRAAKNLGKHSVGIEIEERYCEIAAQRLSQEVLDLGGAA